MTAAAEYHAQILDNPIRKHEAQGIGDVPNSGTYVPKTGISEAARMALEMAFDICHPEAYGHAVPVELLKRAGRICAMLRPKPAVCERPTGVGYQEPPPARCQHCDES